MFRPATRLLVLIAAVQILGGHWAVLQTFAWTKMLIENVQTASLPEAVTKTFDGKRPCSLCSLVAKGQAQEKRQDQAQVVEKLDAILARAVALPPPAETPARYFPTLALDCDHSVAPLTRPPIS